MILVFDDMQLAADGFVVLVAVAAILLALAFGGLLADWLFGGAK